MVKYIYEFKIYISIKILNKIIVYNTISNTIYIQRCDYNSRIQIDIKIQI